MRYLLALALLCALPCSAKDKPQQDYQDGVLVSFRTVTTGTSCRHAATSTGDVDAHTSDDGYTSGTVKTNTEGSTDCSDTREVFYTVRSGENTFVLERDLSKKQTAGAALSLGWSNMFIKASVLANRLPGTQLKLRADGKHIYVRIADKESMYTIVEAK